jgi:integrase
MSRRANGEGSIYEDSDGSWRVSVSLGTGPDGKRLRKRFRAPTKKAALAELKRVQKAQDDEQPIAESRETVGEYLQRWLDNVVADRVEAKTLRTYRYIVATHLVPALGHIVLRKLKVDDVTALLKAARAKPLSPRTCSHIRVVLRTALNDAIKRQLVTRNVAALADPPQLAAKDVEPVSVDEAKAFLQAIADDRLQALYLLLITLGFRQGEVLGLQWADLDLERGTLRLSRSLERADGAYRFKGRKTSAPRRLLPLLSFHVAALQRHRAVQDLERRNAGAWEESDLVFTTLGGRPLHGSVVTHRLGKILERAQLPPRTCRDLRHGMATLLASLGVDLRLIMELLGHSTIRLTADTYTSVSLSTARDAVVLLGEALGWDSVASSPGAN